MVSRGPGIRTPAVHSPVREQGGLSVSSRAGKEVQRGGSPLVKVTGKGERAKETPEEKLGVQDECFFSFHHEIASLLS